MLFRDRSIDSHNKIHISLLSAKYCPKEPPPPSPFLPVSPRSLNSLQSPKEVLKIGEVEGQDKEFSIFVFLPFMLGMRSIITVSHMENNLKVHVGFESVLYSVVST